MQKAAALILTTALLAGCTAAPQFSKSSAEGGQPVAAPQAAVPALPANPIPAKQPEPPTPAPGAVKPETDPPKAMFTVAVPTADQLPAAWRTQLQSWSPWEVADNALVAIYGGKVEAGPFLAPGLAQRIAAVGIKPAETTWRRHVRSWAEGSRFYFQLQVTGRQPDGRLYLAGTDLIEVSAVPGAGAVVTGFLHEPPSTNAAKEPVAVWASGDGYPAPQPLDLPAGILTKAPGVYQIPLMLAERFGPVMQANPGSYVIQLPDGTRTEPVKAEMIGGTPYVTIDQLIQLMNGRQVTASWGAWRYSVQWRADLCQLLLLVDGSHPIS